MAASPADLLALAHVHRVTTQVAGATRDLFVFDPHRQAFACARK